MKENIPLLTGEQMSSTSQKWTNLANTAIKECPKIKKEREIAILCDRFGIGTKAKTLHAIGLTYGVTRERIRQIVNNSIRKIKKYCQTEELKRNIKLIESKIEKQGGVITKDELAQVFGLTETNEQNALNFCATLSDNIYNVKESKELAQGWALKRVKISKIKEIAGKATEELKKSKNPEKIASIAKKIGVDATLLQAILGTAKQTMQTDKKDWGLVTWPDVNPKSIRDKSKYIMSRHGKPLHYSELTKKIGKIGTKKVTQQSVHNELIKNKDFVLIGRGIYAMHDWGYEPGVVEDVIVEVLKEAGEPLHKKIIIERVLERRIVKESTIVLNLQKDRFKRVDKAVYTLN